jgi:hypothetical protein
VANNLVKSIKEARELIGNPALNNYYLVEIPTGKAISTDLSNHMTKYARLSDKTFPERKLGLLCSEASLPTSSYATAEVKDNFLGVTQEFAHTRLYADIDFTFYVDGKYESIKFFEGWMDYISGAGEISQFNISKSPGYFRKMAYPDSYKVSKMKITKFERDIRSRLEYTFINAFPKGMTVSPISYGPADLLKVNVSFNYDRYLMNYVDIPDVVVQDPGKGDTIYGELPTGNENKNPRS